MRHLGPTGTGANSGLESDEEFAFATSAPGDSEQGALLQESPVISLVQRI